MGKEKKQYLLRGDIVTIIHEFTFNKRKYCVVDTDDWLKVCYKDDLIDEKESYSYKIKIENEIAELENSKDKKVKEIQNDENEIFSPHYITKKKWLKMCEKTLILKCIKGEIKNKVRLYNGSVRYDITKNNLIDYVKSYGKKN